MNLSVYFVILLGIQCVPLWAYRMYYIEDECFSPKEQKVVYNIPATGPDSVGEMRTNRFGTYSRLGRNCLLKLVPPKGYGIVVTIKKVDFRNHEPCEDYIMIYTDDNDGEKLCGYQELGLNSKTFHSKDNIKIVYHTEDGGFGFNDGFRLIFTVAKKVGSDDECSAENQFRCANARCIWVGVKCDGHNNCGDASDESTSDYAECPIITPVTIAIIVLGITTVVAICIGICICCCRVQHKAAAKPIFTDFPSRPNGGYIPLPGYTYGTAGSTQGYVVYSPYHAANPTAPTEKSFQSTARNRYQEVEQMASPLELPPPYKN